MGVLSKKKCFQQPSFSFHLADEPFDEPWKNSRQDRCTQDKLKVD